MNTVLNDVMQEAAGALIENLLASETFIHWQQAHICLNEDRHARALLERLSQAQARLREKQTNGGVTQADVDALRAIQQQVQSNKVIMDYAHTQQEAISFLREINQEISQLLGINFASFANRSTC